MQAIDLVKYPEAKYIFSNEIVFRGHPDKVCDQISDAILDAYMSQDKMSRCAIEVVGGKSTIFITGEVTSKAKVNHVCIALNVLRKIGYSDYRKYQVIDNVGTQSPDIALGTNEDVGGAGDQGMMYGYACDDTELYLPTAQCILQRFSDEYDTLVHYGTDDGTKGYCPDGKAQITGLYDANGKLLHIKTFVISFQYSNSVSKRRYETLKDYLVITAETICSDYGLSVDNFVVNNTGAFTIGGFDGDAGLTGRKIIVDTYEGFARHGGGAFSGKDPTKVDRSGAYMARNIARSIVESGCASKCEVQLSYVIGNRQPLGVYVNTFGTGKLLDMEFASIVQEVCDLTPQGIRRYLNLSEVHYEPYARFGHFGHKSPWEDNKYFVTWLKSHLQNNAT